MIRPTAVLVAGAVALTLSGCGGGGNSGGQAGPTSPPSIPGVRTLDFSEPQFHLHFFGPLRYAQRPPFGGAHSPIPLNCGVYTAPVPNENAVHSLEHGAVWLTYKNGVDPAPLVALTDIDQSYTLVSPFPTQTSPVVASVWGKQLRVDSPTDPRLRQFVQSYVRNDFGGEQGARCAGASPEQAQQLLDNPPGQNSQPPPDPADRAD